MDSINMVSMPVHTTVRMDLYTAARAAGLSWSTCLAIGIRSALNMDNSSEKELLKHGNEKLQKILTRLYRVSEKELGKAKLDALLKIEEEQQSATKQTTIEDDTL